MENKYLQQLKDRQNEKIRDLDINKYNIPEDQVHFMKTMIEQFKSEIDYMKIKSEIEES